MLAATIGLSAAQTDVAVAVDEDQVGLYAGVDVARYDGRVMLFAGARDSLAGWTNKVAMMHDRSYRALASLGDDHVPATAGWDTLLLAAIDQMGGTGIAYGDDKLMGENLPTAPVISADIVRVLGWMCEPSLRHMCVDCVWKDLGEQADCLAYVPDVIIRHVHWCNNGVPMDETYAAAEAVKEADRERYAVWQRERMAGDVDKIVALRGAKAA